jgi:isoleucyl-tRNA synthetase
VAEKVAGLGHEEIKSILSGKPLALPQGDLTADDILVVREVRVGLVVEASQDLTVALETAIDHGLRLEMLARETVSKIQNLRKDSGLEVTDRVVVRVKTGSPLFREAVEKHFSYISAEVLASSLDLAESPSESSAGDAEHTLEVNGEIAIFSVSKKV